METGSVLYKIGNAPKNTKVDDYDIPEMMNKAILNELYIEHDHNDAGERIERAIFSSSVRNYYLSRPRDTEDSLATIRQSNYLDPRSAIMHTLPSQFGVDDVVTEETCRILLEKGLAMSTIKCIVEEKPFLVKELESLYHSALETLPVKERTPERIKSLRDYFIDAPYPYTFIPLGAPPRHTKHSGTQGDTYALATSIPQNISDMLCKKYINDCVAYMLGEMENRCGVKEVTLDTDIYYDFWVAEDAVLYLFVQLI